MKSSTSVPRFSSVETREPKGASNSLINLEIGLKGTPDTSSINASTSIGQTTNFFGESSICKAFLCATLHYLASVYLAG